MTDKHKDEDVLNTSLINCKDKQAKTITWHHPTAYPLTKIKSNSTKGWKRCSSVSLIYCWWKCKLASHFGFILESSLFPYSTLCSSSLSYTSQRNSCTGRQETWTRMFKPTRWRVKHWKEPKCTLTQKWRR